MNDQIMTTCQQTVQLLEGFCRDQENELTALAKRLASVFTEGGQLLVAASGCLQPAAQLLAGQFVFRLGFERPVLPAVALGTDMVIAGRMYSDKRGDQLYVRHYRAINSSKHLLLLISDGSGSAGLQALRDEVVENEQDVALLSYNCSEDELMTSDVEFCLSLASRSLARQLELTQFAGHLLCELVETELFG